MSVKKLVLTLALGFLTAAGSACLAPAPARASTAVQVQKAAKGAHKGHKGHKGKHGGKHKGGHKHA